LLKLDLIVRPKSFLRLDIPPDGKDRPYYMRHAAPAASAIADDRERDNGRDTAANPLPPDPAIEPNGTIIFRHYLRLACGTENGHALWSNGTVDEGSHHMGVRLPSKL
jgi:hypothetical protein